jgi:uncharacterized membrane protein
MSFSFLGPFHPVIVHTPIALLIFSAFFALVSRLFDRDWLKKTSVILLVFGFLGAWLAVQSGKPAHRVPEHEQGVPEDAIDAHAMIGNRVVLLAGGALVAIGIASRLSGNAATAMGIVGLVLQLLAAGAVGYTGFLGGKLVYEHGANVRIAGELVKNPGAGTHGSEGEGGTDKSGKTDHD